MGQGIMAMGGGISTLISSRSEANSIRARADAERRQFQLNSEIAEMQAEEAVSMGKEESRQILIQNKQLIGSQRAALAAQGIELDSGSALQLQEDTAVIGALDALTIRHNAAKQAMGFKIDAIQGKMSASMASAAGQSRASSTLLAGQSRAMGNAYEAVGSFANYKSDPTYKALSSYGADKADVNNYPTTNENLTRKGG